MHLKPCRLILTHTTQILVICVWKYDTPPKDKLDVSWVVTQSNVVEQIQWATKEKRIYCYATDGNYSSKPTWRLIKLVPRCLNNALTTSIWYPSNANISITETHFNQFLHTIIQFWLKCEIYNHYHITAQSKYAHVCMCCLQNVNIQSYLDSL